jgi:hypothetical protein
VVRIVTTALLAAQLKAWADLPEYLRETLCAEGVNRACDWRRLSPGRKRLIFGVPKSTRRMLDALARRAP